MKRHDICLARERKTPRTCLRLNSILWHYSIAFNVPFKLELFFFSLSPFFCASETQHDVRDRVEYCHFLQQQLFSVKRSTMFTLTEIVVLMKSKSIQMLLKVFFHLFTLILPCSVRNSQAKTSSSWLSLSVYFISSARGKIHLDTNLPNTQIYGYTLKTHLRKLVPTKNECIYKY